jgi:acetate kinase
VTILAINTGSSTLKFALYPVHHGQVQNASLSGSFSGLEPRGNAIFSWRMQDDGLYHQEALTANGRDVFEAALQRLQMLLRDQGVTTDIQAVAHRVVHGGANYHQAIVVDDAAMEALQALSPLAPLHQPHNLMGIALCRRSDPGLPQVACFDTAFHATLPEAETRFAFPESLHEQGIRRYGFHGLSYQYVMAALRGVSTRAQGRVVMAHLGNGASLCATYEGRSSATTMGFSALDGLMMGTRCGALDAGVLLHLLRKGWSVQQLEDLLYRQSGLLGVSGVSADMRRLREDASPSARLAIDLFEHRIVREIGAMSACVQGLDVLAFTGGIGEHDALLRAHVCSRLSYLGIHLDASANSQAHGTQVVCIHEPNSAVEVWVVPTDEGKVAAQAAADLVCLN